MTQTTYLCSHKFCNEPVNRAFARWKFDKASGEMVPFHTDCSHAAPDYDVSKGCGSPFTEITVKAI